MGAEKMNDYKKYWIWLSMTLGASARVDEVFSAFKSPHKIFESTEKERILAGVFTRKQLENLKNPKLDNALTAVSVCEKNGWQILTPDDADYPKSLSRLPDLPLVLYVDGDINCLKDKIAIGVVGTRKPCYESIAITRKICGDLASAGAVVVSGGALGIDSAAHEGTLAAGGKTVCVMGCGLGARYLMENEAMRRQISKNGALVSEFAPLSSASRITFPQRNRIISGLSDGVLVVEAGDKSGSLITANCASEQGREVFAIPGSVLSTAYSGANKLIRDGAKAATCAEDILLPYSIMYPDRVNIKAAGSKPAVAAEKPQEETKIPPHVKKECPSGLDPDEQAVYNLFGEGPLHFDEICAMSGLAAPRVMTVLMELELSDYIEQTEGKNYTLK